ncbi:hypothetical protein D9M68_949410 [compost metagenome]
MERIQATPSVGATGRSPLLDGLVELHQFIQLLEQAGLLPAQRPGQGAQVGGQRLGQELGPVSGFIEALVCTAKRGSAGRRQGHAITPQLIQTGQFALAQQLDVRWQRALPMLLDQLTLLPQDQQA